MSEITVIIPCLDAARTIGATLRSLVSERSLLKEILVVDAASTDGTPESAEEFGRALSLPVRTILARRGCAGSMRNIGLEAARGRWIYFIDADDEHVAGGLASLHAALAGRAGAEIALGSFIRSADGVKRRRKTPRRYGHAPLVNASDYVSGRIPSIGVGSALVERSAIGSLRFAENLPYDEDTLFWAALLAQRQVAIADAVVFVYNVDTKRADDRFVTGPRKSFLAWRASLRRLTRHGIDGRAIRLREGLVALKIARVHYARGQMALASRFLDVALAAPMTPGARWRTIRYRLKVVAALRAEGRQPAVASAPERLAGVDAA